MITTTGAPYASKCSNFLQRGITFWDEICLNSCRVCLVVSRVYGQGTPEDHDLRYNMGSLPEEKNDADFVMVGHLCQKYWSPLRAHPPLPITSIGVAVYPLRKGTTLLSMYLAVLTLSILTG